MGKYFFTYGTEGQPYNGGWTVVEAPDQRAAALAFRAFHPDRTDGLLNCSSIYDEEHFTKTRMAVEGNFGAFCREIITLSIRKS